jgi:hypothetical protein
MILQKISIFLIISFLLSSCGLYRPTDVREVPVNERDRVKKNMEEGRGLRLDTLGKGNRGGDFQFASSNPLWRSTLKVLDFAPLISANYSGGIIITDWVYFDESNNDESFKITVKFLSNEIRSDALDISLHQKVCLKINQCSVKKIENSTNDEIAKKILKIATLYEKEDQEKLKEELGEYNMARPKK